MSTLTTERLYALLPAVYRLRDVEQGEPLRALLSAFAAEFAVLEENIEQLYDDQFIETCADWVAPYIGDLIGYQPLHGVAPAVASPRAEVANTIAYRRRKGTALMLEQMASDVTGWPAHVVEYFQLLGTTQYMKHIRPGAGGTADLRDLRSCLQEGGAFEAFAHTAAMRQPETRSGRYNIPNIGIFLWRLLALGLTEVPLTPDPGDASGRKFRVNPLGADLQLFRNAQREPDISHLSEPINVPEPLSVRLLALSIKAAQATTDPLGVVDDDYGVAESLQLFRPDAAGPQPVPVSQIRVCDLSDILDGGGTVIGWNHEAAVNAGEIGVDPERGRVLLGAPADGPLLASFYYGTPSAIGGGLYERQPDGIGLPLQAVSNGAGLQAALDLAAPGGQVLIGDCLTYAETPIFKVDSPGAPNTGRVVVTAPKHARPLIAASGDIELEIAAGGELVLEGLVISGGRLHLGAAADTQTRKLVLRDCTLVPGLALEPDGSAVSSGAPSLVVEHPFATVTLERCITGPLLVAAEANIRLSQCIVDAGAAENPAFAGDAAGGPGAQLVAIDCTVIGKIHASLIELASNCIFDARLAAADSFRAPVLAERRQEGCMRFSYVPPGSVTPRRYRCVPEDGGVDPVLEFTSLRYGDPAYGQLRGTTDHAIRTGAEDEGEMGVLRSLSQPQRETNLRIRLDEYLRLGLRAGVFFAS